VVTFVDAFIKNGWYAAAWSEEVGRTLLERWIANAPVVMYRAHDGRPIALDGTCPHRGYPLAMGRLDGDVVECGYHGIAFDCSGACARVPGGGEPQKAMRVASYPLVERGGLIWIWPGDPERADPALIAERWLADPAWKSVHGTKIINCRASLLIENLLDLSHETYLHAGSIGEPGVAASPITTTLTDRHVSAQRVIPNVVPAPLFQKAGLSGRIDRGQDAQYWVPGLCLTLASATPREPGQTKVRWSVIHCVTPETPTRTRYLWAVARDYALDDANADAAWFNGSNNVFDQDVIALEAQEARLAALPPDHIELSIPGDAAALASRKLIRQHLRAERAPALV
jgi:vanillate O-demethylase monooxygenase subunit